VSRRTLLSHAQQIRRVASAFRKGLEAARWPNHEEFPTGCCGNASDMLGVYLKSRGLGDFDYIGGGKQSPRAVDGEIIMHYQSHAWLKQGRIIVDITADQFPEVQEEVIVTTRSAWHRQWSIEGKPRPAGHWNGQYAMVFATAAPIAQAILDADEQNAVVKPEGLET
jgi:hypothetical protein